MSHLIARRNRVREMLAEVEHDPYVYYAPEVLRQYISDENYVFLVAEIEQVRDLRERRKVKEGWTDFDLALPKASAFEGKLADHRKWTTTHRSRLAHWTKLHTHAAKMMAIHTNYITQILRTTQEGWAALSDRERAAFGRPPANQGNVDNWPSLTHRDNGLFYPEPSAWRTVVAGKLRHALEMLEQEIAEKGGEA